MDYSQYAVLLLLVALTLTALEVFIPSGGLILVMSVTSLGVSVWCAWQAWWVSNPTAWWSYVASVAILMPVVIIGAFTLFPKTSIGRRVLLEGPAPDEIAGFGREEERLRQYVGRRGKALTLLVPGGMAIIEGERLHVETEGIMIEQGEPVEVVAVRGTRLLVRRPATQEEVVDPLQAEAERDEKAPLDFDIPQS